MAKNILTPDEFAWESRTGKKNAQTVLNCILWGIIMDKGGTINVSCEEVKNLPESTIKVKVADQRVYLTVKEKKVGLVLN